VYSGFANKPAMHSCRSVTEGEGLQLFFLLCFDLGPVLYERIKKTTITTTPRNGPDDRLFNVLRVSLLISYAYYKLPI